MASELDGESSEIKDLTWLITREDYLITQCRGSFKSYKIIHLSLCLA